ncbi:hypothetical protein HKD37_15G042915 [Glycine soja]
MQLFLVVVGWYSCLVSNFFLACKLAINQPVEWRHQLNQSNSFHACKLAINQPVEWSHRLNLRCFAHLYAFFVCLWWSYLPGNSFLACKLAINQPVEWRHRLNLMHFAHLLCIFGMPLVELFARYVDSNMFDVVFCIRAFQPKQLFLPVVGWYSCLVSDSLLSSKLAIDQPVD